MNCKKNANSNPGEERQLFHPESEKVVEIGLERLRPFKNHPFKVKEDEAMAQLMESIERYGILNPLIVMPTREGVYQIVSGHRRKYCAEKLGYTQVPVIIRYMKEEDSIISMVEELLGVVNEEAAMDIEIYKISGFKGHPFKVIDDEKMQELVESIKVAQYVYEECFVNGRDVEEILSDDPRKTEAILATYMLFLNNENGDVGMPS